VGRRIAAYRVLDGRCAVCGGPLTTPLLRPDEEHHLPAMPATVGLCVLCVARVLVRATLVIHGEPSPHPASNRCEGHEERMRSHEERVQKELAELVRLGPGGDFTRDIHAQESDQ
jgi:hypothetical protein